MKRFDMLLPGEKKKITTVSKVNGLAQLFFKAIQHGKTEKGKTDIDLGSELAANTTGTFTSSFLPKECVPFKKDHLFTSFKGQMIGSACAHHPTAYDHNICNFRNVHLLIISYLYLIRLNKATIPKMMITIPEILFTQRSPVTLSFSPNIPTPLLRRSHHSVEPINIPRTNVPAEKKLPFELPTPNPATTAVKKRTVRGLVRVKKKVEA
jgi:hypothetical protein